MYVRKTEINRFYRSCISGAAALCVAFSAGSAGVWAEQAPAVQMTEETSVSAAVEGGDGQAPSAFSESGGGASSAEAPVAPEEPASAAVPGEIIGYGEKVFLQEGALNPLRFLPEGEFYLPSESDESVSPFGGQDTVAGFGGETVSAYASGWESQQDEIRQVLQEGMRDIQPSIDLSKYLIPKADLVRGGKFYTFFVKTVNTAPDVFYVRSGFGYYPGGPGGAYIGSLCPLYTDGTYNYRQYTSTDDAKLLTESVRTKMKSMIGGYEKERQKYIEHGMRVRAEGGSDKDVAMAIYTELAQRVNYNHEVLNGKEPKPGVYTAYAAMVEHNAVCQGYTMAYNDILNHLGFTTDYQTGGNHAWSLVKINDNDGQSGWFHLDVTWADGPATPTPYVQTRELHNDVNYKYFLKSGSFMAQNQHTVPARTASHEQTAYNNTSLDSHWTEKIYNTNLYFKDGYWYYFDQASGVANKKYPVQANRQMSFPLKKQRLKDSSSTNAGASFSYTFGNMSTNYLGNYTRVNVDFEGDYIFLSDMSGSKIYVYGWDGAKKKEFSADSGRRIQQFYVDQGIVRMDQVSGSSRSEKTAKAYDYVPPFVTVSGEMAWEGDLKPSSLTILLMKNGTKVDSQIISEKTGWKWRFENLYKGAKDTYTVQVDPASVPGGFTIRMEGNSIICVSQLPYTDPAGRIQLNPDGIATEAASVSDRVQITMDRKGTDEPHYTVGVFGAGNGQEKANVPIRVGNPTNAPVTVSLLLAEYDNAQTLLNCRVETVSLRSNTQKDLELVMESAAAGFAKLDIYALSGTNYKLEAFYTFKTP